MGVFRHADRDEPYSPYGCAGHHLLNEPRVLVDDVSGPTGEVEDIEADLLLVVIC
jgi:hypothetical protein